LQALDGNSGANGHGHRQCGRDGDGEQITGTKDNATHTSIQFDQVVQTVDKSQHGKEADEGNKAEAVAVELERVWFREQNRADQAAFCGIETWGKPQTHVSLCGWVSYGVCAGKGDYQCESPSRGQFFPQGL